jgi:hypothetical protein
MLRALRLLTLCFLLTLTARGTGQEKSGLKFDPNKPTNIPGAFHPYNVTGPWGERKAPKEAGSTEPDKELKGNYHCPVSEHNLDPCVLLFVKEVEPTAGLKELLKKLDNSVEKNPAVRLHVTAVFFSEKLPEVAGETDKTDDLREQLAMKLKSLATELNLKHVVLGLAGQKDIEAYLSEGADVTVVGYKRLLVTFVQALTEKDIDSKIKDVMADVVGKFGAKRE